MDHWKRINRGVDRHIPLYSRRKGYRNREFAVKHPVRGLVSLGVTTREACYDLMRLRHMAEKARHLLMT